MKLFEKISAKNLKNSEIAERIGVSTRTINDWKRGKYTIPALAFSKLIEFSELSRDDLVFKEFSDWWQMSDAGKSGAKTRFERYGALGTRASRQLGGKNSYKFRRNNPKDIFARKIIKIPKLDENLAEFVGIMIGDGSMNQYQVSIALSSVVDYEYAAYVENLIEELFAIKPKVAVREKNNCIVIAVSSVGLTEYLHNIGVVSGDKIKQGLNIPEWIMNDKGLVLACIRGIFDTDGCIYYEKHIIKGKIYKYPRISIVSASFNLLESIHDVLDKLEMKPKIRNNRSVNIENRINIDKFFDIVGAKNPKHLSRYYGGVG